MRDKRISRLIFTACGVVAFVLCIDYLGLLSGLNRQVYDLFHRFRGSREASSDILIAAIDERTLQRLGRWPIDRRHYAVLLDHLKNAEVVGIDIILGEASENDGMLADAVARHGKVVLPVYFDPEGRLILPPASVGATALGHTHIEQDVDGITREVVHTIRYGNEMVPSFASAIYDMLPGKGLSREEPMSTEGIRASSAFLVQADRMIINYYGRRESFRHMSFLEILEGRWPEDLFKGKVVLVGLTAAGVEGELLTPFTDEGSRMSGVEVHAHILNNLLDGTRYRRLEPPWIGLVLSILACLVFAFGARRTPLQLGVVWFFSMLGISAFVYSCLVVLNVWIMPGPFYTLVTAALASIYVMALHDMRASLLQAQKDWEESFDSIDDAIAIYGRDCRVARLNRAASEKIGDSLFQSLGRMCSEFVRIEEPIETSLYNPMENRDRADRDEEVYDHEMNRHFEVRMMPRKDERGCFCGVVQVLRDITARKLSEKERERLQAMLVQAQKMEAIGTLAGGVAHDFNNILSAVIGYAELALLDKEMTPRIKKHLEEVLKAGGRAKELVQQILNLSRQRKQELRPVEITPLVKEVIQFLRASLPKTIEIRKDFRADSACTLSDPIHIHQILMNLCTNAAHAMREQGGTLEVSLETIDLSEEDKVVYPDLSPGPYIKMSVADTGPGIEKCIRDRIFDPYFTTKPPGEGTGMGLAVVQNIIKSHRGTITLYSEIGRGTVFHVILPRIAVEGVTEARTLERIPRGHERVLYVDDEETLAYLGKEVLESLGYDVVAKTSSREALDIFLAEPGRFDILITDQTMPHMTGMTLAEKILEVCPHVPIILCTGYSDLLSKEKVQALGIKAFLMKPLLIRELATAIRKAIDGPGD